MDYLYEVKAEHLSAYGLLLIRLRRNFEDKDDIKDSREEVIMLSKTKNTPFKM